MDEKKTLFLLGADDPEMKWIASVLHNANLKWEIATHGGKRVTPGKAYHADGVNLMFDAMNAFDVVVQVECKPRRYLFQRTPQLVTIDHHRPGDPGYDIGPEAGPDWYWHGSSIGQLVWLLRKEFPQAYKRLGLITNEPLRRHLWYVAAMDHCYAAARRGECEGVNPEDVKRQQMENICSATGMRINDFHRRTTYFTEALRRAPEMTIGGSFVRDMRMFPLGPGYDAEYLCLREAAIGLDTPYLCRYREAEGEGEKVVLNGASNEAVEYFIKFWASQHGILDIYGVPKRGYAGGYLKPPTR